MVRQQPGAHDAQDKGAIKSHVFADWVNETKPKYATRSLPSSLAVTAEDRVLKISHLETILQKWYCAPPSLLEALHNWDKKGGQVTIQRSVILRVDTPKILQALRASSAGRFIEDPLGPTAALVHPDAVKKITAALARLGYLSDVRWESLAPDRATPKD